MPAAIQNCINCQFSAASISKDLLECHLTPPKETMIATDSQHPYTQFFIPKWQIVKPTDWCGDWKQRGA